MRSTHRIVVSLFVCALTLHARGALLVNPSFEQPVVPNPDFQYYYAGDTSITGWTIVGGSVDVLSTNWQAHEGKQSVDLSGVSTGGLYQNINTTAGTTYRLGFWLAGNSEFQGNFGTGPLIKMMKLSWAGSPVATLSFDVTGKTKTNPGWTFYSYDLTATNPSTRLEFDSVTSGTAGPLIDDLSFVQIAPPASVPLPGGLGSGVLAAGTLLVARRRFRR
jgi:choice-of-anchor C domain-containing protein